jgi:hypothetical protein
VMCSVQPQYSRRLVSNDLQQVQSPAEIRRECQGRRIGGRRINDENVNDEMGRDLFPVRQNTEHENGSVSLGIIGAQSVSAAGFPHKCRKRKADRR